MPQQHQANAEHFKKTAAHQEPKLGQNTCLAFGGGIWIDCFHDIFSQAARDEESKGKTQFKSSASRFDTVFIRSGCLIMLSV